MNARWLIALLVSVGCSEYEIAQGKDGENGADDTLIFPDEDTGGVDTGDFEDTEEDIRLFEAVDRMKVKYGSRAVIRANTLGTGSRVRMNQNLFRG